jgi:hypothetical protein
MTFMYLHLMTDQYGKVHASVKNNGALTFSSLGGPDSQGSHGPFAVFKIEDFDGIENIDNENLLNELLRRFTVRQLIQYIQIHMSTKEILELLSERLTDRH